MEQPWDSVFYNFMRRPWLYFFYRFHASIVNSLTLSIPCGRCHSVFFYDFKVYYYSLMASDIWIIRDRVFFTFPCVGQDSIFAIDLMRRSWIHWRCRCMLYLSLSIHWPFLGLRLVCFGRRFMDQPWHSVIDNSIPRPWLYFCYVLDASVVNSLTVSMHAVPVTQYSLTISRSTVTLFWPPIYGSAVT